MQVAEEDDAAGVLEVEVTGTSECPPLPPAEFLPWLRPLGSPRPPRTSTASTPACKPAERSKFPVRLRYWYLGVRESRGRGRKASWRRQDALGPPQQGCRAQLPGQPSGAQSPFHIHVLALKVHQDDAEAGVPRAGVQRGHVGQELGHPARLVLHWRKMVPPSPSPAAFAVPLRGQWCSLASLGGLLEPTPHPGCPARAPGTMKCTITSWRQARRSGRQSSGRPSGRAEAAGAGSGLSPSLSASPAWAPGSRRKTYSDRRRRPPPRSCSSSSRRKRLPRAESRRFSTFTMRRSA